MLWLFSTCQRLPQLQGSAATRNNNLRGQEGRRNNNRDSIATNRPANRGQRILEGGFVPSNFGNELRNVRFPGKATSSFDFKIKLLVIQLIILRKF